MRTLGAYGAHNIFHAVRRLCAAGVRNVVVAPITLLDDADWWTTYRVRALLNTAVLKFVRYARSTHTHTCIQLGCEHVHVCRPPRIDKNALLVTGLAEVVRNHLLAESQQPSGQWRQLPCTNCHRTDCDRARNMFE
jgi:hypothetical protein